jgi:hypothetical protein
MDALLIGPALIVSVSVSLVAGKAMLHLFMKSLDNRTLVPVRTRRR